MNALMIELILGRSAHGKIVVLFRGTRVPKETMTVVDFSPVIQLKILDTGTIDTVHCQSQRPQSHRAGLQMGEATGDDSTHDFWRCTSGSRVHIVRTQD